MERLLYPYMEVIKKAEDGTVYLLTMSFINKSLEIEMYENRMACGDYGNNELFRVESLKQRAIREFNRE